MEDPKSGSDSVTNICGGSGKGSGEPSQVHRDSKFLALFVAPWFV